MSKEVRKQVKSMGRADLLALIEEDEIDINPKGKRLSWIRKKVISHFDDVSKSKEQVSKKTICNGYR